MLYLRRQSKLKTSEMKNVYKTLNNIQTHLLTWGDPFECDGKDVIVCITGNPGLPDFYQEFGSELHNNIDLPVCVIGQSGHEEVPDTNSNVMKGQEHLFNLEGQIKHKADLIKAIDNKSKLHLIGHSIGAWMITEMLFKNAPLLDRTSSVNLLFPTLQRMAESKNGSFLNNIIRNIHLFIIFLCTIFNFIPKTVQIFLIRMYLKLKSLPEHYLDRVLKFLKPRVVEKVLLLAYDEMDRVKNLNTCAIDKFKHLTYVTYSVKDDWAPLHFMEDLQQFEPDLIMNKVDIDHSFVLRYSEQVADIVSGCIKEKCVTK